MTSTQTIALADFHHRQGAKWVRFAGYSLPLHYRLGIVQEHLQCRSRAVLFDVSHMGQCRVTGAGALVALTRLMPADLSQLAPGQQCYTVLTNAEGGVIDDLKVSRLAEQEWHLVVNAANKAGVFAYLGQHLNGAGHLEILTDQALLALQGPLAEVVIRQWASSAVSSLAFQQVGRFSLDGLTLIISRSGYTGEDGFELAVANHQAEALARRLTAFPEVEWAGLGARDSLRLEAGLCLYGHELTATITPVEAGLGWLLKHGAHEFPGAARLRAQLADGPARQRMGFKVDGLAPIRAGAPVFNQDGRSCGHVTSGGYAPSLKRPIAMALVERAAGMSFFTELRGRRVDLIPCSMPFVPHRYVRRRS